MSSVEEARQGWLAFGTACMFPHETTVVTNA